jgi:hypothetical protein
MQQYAVYTDANTYDAAAARSGVGGVRGRFKIAKIKDALRKCKARLWKKT